MTKITVGAINNQQLPYCFVNYFLYSSIRSSRVYRRDLLIQLLKIFDNDSSTQTLTLEEQLFVVEQIDLSVSVCGSTQLQQFRDLLKESNVSMK